jgi:hypothetical protein
MKVNVNINVKVAIPVTLGVILLLVPASLGESTRPVACDGELRLVVSLGNVKTPQALRAKVVEAQKLMPPSAELSRIARDAKNASPARVSAVKEQLIALLEEGCVDKD